MGQRRVIAAEAQAHETAQAWSENQPPAPSIGREWAMPKTAEHEQKCDLITACYFKPLSFRGGLLHINSKLIQEETLISF